MESLNKLSKHQLEQLLEVLTRHHGYINSEFTEKRKKVIEHLIKEMNYDDYKLSNPYDDEDVFGNTIDSEEEENEAADRADDYNDELKLEE